MSSNLKSYIGEDYDEKNAKDLLAEIQKNGMSKYLLGCYQLITSLRNYSEQYCYLRSCITGIFHALKYSNLSNEKKEINTLINAMYELDHLISDSKESKTSSIEFESRFETLLIAHLSLITNKLHMEYFVDYARIIFLLNISKYAADLNEGYFDELLNKIKNNSPKEKKTISKI